MTSSKYAAFAALDPFFDIVMQGLAGAVHGDYYFDAIADDAVFEYRYVFPGFPTKIEGRDALMALYAGYGDSTVLHERRPRRSGLSLGGAWPARAPPQQDERVRRPNPQAGERAASAADKEHRRQPGHAHGPAGVVSRRKQEHYAIG